MAAVACLSDRVAMSTTARPQAGLLIERISLRWISVCSTRCRGRGSGRGGRRVWRRGCVEVHDLPVGRAVVGHLGRPGPLGSPVRAKLVQYCCIRSESSRSSGRTASGRESSVPKTYSMSSEWKAPTAGCGCGRRGGQLEEVAVDGRVAGGACASSQRPCAVGDGAVAGIVAGGAQGFCVGRGGIELEESSGGRRSRLGGLRGEAVGAGL